MPSGGCSAITSSKIELIIPLYFIKAKYTYDPRKSKYTIYRMTIHQCNLCLLTITTFPTQNFFTFISFLSLVIISEIRVFI